MILGLFLIVPIYCYSTSSQDSVLVSVNQIRKANELIVEGQKYKELDAIKGKQIIELENQILTYEEIKRIQEDIIIKKDTLIHTRDYIIDELKKEIEFKEKEIKKQKQIKVLTMVSSALLVVIVLL